MLTEEQLSRTMRSLSFLQEVDSPLIGELKRVGTFVRIPAGREIFVEGDKVDSLALLISGVVRVFKIGESGREITLYRFGAGETCVITANAIINTQDFPAIALVEKDAEAVMIPAVKVSDWIRDYDSWRRFVFNMSSQRLVGMMEIVDEVAFQRMDRRIAAMLLERTIEDSHVEITHQQIADELGSSREVISRLLQDLAGKELIRLSRGQVEVLDRAGLREYLSV